MIKISKNSDIDLLLNARLDVSETRGIVADISTLSTNLKNSPLDLQVSIKNSDLSKLKGEIDAIQKSLSSIGKNATIPPIGESLSGGLKGANDDLKNLELSIRNIDGTLTKKRQFFDDKNLNEAKRTVLEVNQGLGKTLKITESTKQEFEVVTDKLKAQTQLYKQLNTLAKEESQLRNKMMGAKGDELNQLQEMLNKNGQVKQSVNDIINSNREMYYNKQMEVDLHANLDRLLDNQLLKQAEITQKEKERISLLGQKVSGDKPVSGIDFNNIKQVDDYVRSVMGANVEVTNVTQAHSKLRKGISDTSKQVYEITATQQLANNKMKEFKFIADENTSSMYKMGEAIKPIPNKLMGVVAQMGEAMIKSAQWGISMGILYGSLRKLSEGIETVKQLDAELTQVAVTMGLSRDQTKSYADTIVDTAIRLRHSVADVSAVNVELVRQGLSLEEAGKRMDTILKLASVGAISASESTKIITSSVNALGEEAEKTADVLVMAGNISASSVEEIGEAFTKVASSAKSTGVGLEEMSAILATLVEVTQESPSSLGNSLKTLISRFNSVNEETGEVNKEINKVQTAFESVGIAFTDAEGQIRPLYDLLSDLGGIWGSLDKNTRNYISTQSAGVMQANRFLAIMDNFGRVQEINNDLMGSAGTLAKGYETVLGSVQARADRAKASLEGMWINAINSDAIGFFYDMSYALTRVIDFFGVFSIAIVALIMVLQALHAQSVANDGAFAKWTTTMIANGVATKASAVATYEKIRAVGLLTTITESQTLADLKSGVTMKSLGVIMDVLKGKITIATGAKLLFGKAGIIATGGVATLGTAILGIIPLLIKFALLTGGLTLLTGGISLLFSKFAGGSKEATTSIDDLNGAIGQSSANIKTLQSVSDEYEILTQKMGKARDMSKLTADEQARYNDIMGQIEQIAPNYITYLGESNDKMLVYGKTLDDIIAKEKELINVKKQEMVNEQDVINEDIENKRAELLEKQKELDKKVQNLDNVKKYDDSILPNSMDTEKYISKINTLKTEIQQLSGELDGLQSKQLQVLETLMQKLDDVTGATESMKTLAKESVMEIFETEGFDKASASIDDFTIVLEESVKMLDETGQQFNYTEEASQELKNAFDRLGMDESDIIGFLHRLAIQLGLTKQGFDGLTGTIGYDLERIEEMQKVNKSIGDMYENLAKGSKLSTEEMNRLIEEHSEIAEYVAETGDISLQNGELLRGIWSDLNEEMTQHFETLKSENIQTIQSLEAEIGLKNKSLELMKGTKAEGTKAYKELKSEIDGMKNSLKDSNQELDRNLAKIEALKRADSGQSDEQIVGVSVQGIEQAEKQITSYNKILQEMDKNGKLSADTYRMIIREHHELLGVLDNEAAMRDLIKEKIRETEETAVQSYKNLLMVNGAFYKKMISENADMFNRIGNMYNLNVANFKNMAELMGQIANITGREVAKALSFSVSMNQGFSTQLSGNSNTLDIQQRRSEINKEIADLNKAKNSVAGKMLYGGEIAINQKIGLLQNSLKDLNKASSSLVKESAVKQQISSLTEQKATSGIANLGAISSAGGGSAKKADSKGKQSKESEAREVDRIDVTKSIDAYLRWEQAILRVDEALSRQKIFLDRATGEDRINLIDKENNLLKEKQKLLSSLNNEQRREQSILNQRLTKRGVKTNSATQGASDVERLVMARQSQLDSLTNQINAIKTDTPQRESLINKRDDLKEGIESLVEDFDRYIEVSNNISSKSNEWWEIQSQILDNQLARIEEGLKKYDDRLTMLDQQISLLGNIRDNRPKEIEKEIELLDRITETTKNRRAELNSQLYTSGQKIKDLEKALESFGKTRNEQYKAIYQNLITEREYNKVLMDNFMQDTLNLNKAMQDATNKRVDGLKREKEGILKNIEALTEMKNIYNDRTLKTDGREIQHRLDLLNKVFREDAMVRLDTSGIQSDLDKINGYYNSLKDKYDSLDKQTIFREEDVEKITQIEDALSKIQKDGITQEMKSSFRIVETTVEKAKKELEEILKLEKNSVEENKKKAKALEEVMTSQAKLIKQNEEEAKKLQEEIEDLEFSYKEIEASLQNRIDLKEEELNQLREQYRQEEKVRQQIEKQLELLRALDDRRYSYITGTGEEVFSYDVSAVNKLRQEVDKMSREDKQQKAEEQLAEEIRQMKEELARTKEINKLDIAVRELQLTALNENTEAIKNMLDKTKEDFTNVYDNLGDQLIDEFKKAMEGMVATHERLYGEYLARKSYDAPTDSFKHQGSGSPFYEQGNYGAKKGQSMSTIAKNLGTTVEALKILNPQLANEKDKLSKDYNIKTPPLGTVDKFDTGGYTGNFSGGKMAMLHEKELVLNKNDTANFLDAINISRLLAKDLQVGERDWGSRQSSNNSGDQPIYIENVNLPSVKDGKSFVNELHGLLRKGQNRLV